MSAFVNYTGSAHLTIKTSSPPPPTPQPTHPPPVLVAQPRSPSWGSLKSRVDSLRMVPHGPLRAPYPLCSAGAPETCNRLGQGYAELQRLLARCAAGGARTVGCGCGKSRAEAPPHRAPPAARPLGRGAGQRAERRGVLAARTPTTPWPRACVIRVALEHRSAARRPLCR